mmetsp:Transcript_56926/g.113110  ORF Transcript_56926/g.113110 Transcript_56926/m.113110 type:complete len:247 (-) Transcript_56926:240-980(-)
MMLAWTSRLLRARLISLLRARLIIFQASIMQLLFNPATTMANPCQWLPSTTAAAVSKFAVTQSDTVHCMGGGSLLLWLLLRSTRHQQRMEALKHVPIVIHGDLVLPTPESVVSWVSSQDISAYEWQRQGIMLGVGGDLRKPENAWLKSVSADLAAGRFGELESDMLRYIDHWDKKDMLEWRSTSGDPRGPFLNQVAHRLSPMMVESTNLLVSARDTDFAPVAAPAESERRVDLLRLQPLLSSLQLP